MNRPTKRLLLEIEIKGTQKTDFSTYNNTLKDKKIRAIHAYNIPSELGKAYTGEYNLHLIIGREEVQVLPSTLLNILTRDAIDLEGIENIDWNLSYLALPSGVTPSDVAGRFLPIIVEYEA